LWNNRSHESSASLDSPGVHSHSRLHRDDPLRTASAGPRRADSELIRQGTQLDLEGKGVEARAVFQKAIDSAPTPAAKANAQRAMAMSWAFEGNCQKTVEYEGMVIDYWKTQEKDTPSNAFYQEGEMADEAARVCIDNGELDTADELYKKGHDLGVNEPNISPGRKDLWDYRWEHAQARIAARRGNKREAEKHVAAPKPSLDDMKQKDPKLYEQQVNFLPYFDRRRRALHRRLQNGPGRPPEGQPERCLRPMPHRDDL
jgi:hypothetical protein